MNITVHRYGGTFSLMYCPSFWFLSLLTHVSHVRMVCTYFPSCTVHPSTQKKLMTLIQGPPLLVSANTVPIFLMGVLGQSPFQGQRTLFSARLGYIRLCQVGLGGVRLGQVGLGGVRWEQVGLGWVRLGQVGLGQVRLGQVGLGWVRLGQVRLGLKKKLGQVRFET